MKKHIVKVISVLMCLCLAVGIIATVRITASSASSSRIILYHNDRQWSVSTRLPAEMDEDGVIYVPLTVFVQLPNVKARINNTLQTFIIIHGDYYLSFDTATGYAADQDKQRMPIKIYERYGEWYVPVEEVCMRLQLGYECEVSAATGDTAVRITDGDQEYSFKTLLRRRHPGFYAETTETETPETTSPPETDYKLTERTVYITIEDCPGSYTEDILDVLAEYNVKATFFIVGESALESPQVLSRIAAEGHAIALHTMTHDSELLTDAQAIISDIEAENQLISKLIRQKSRIWRAPDGSNKLKTLTSDVRDELYAAGYIIWDANISIGSNYASYYAADLVISGIKNNDVAVIRFCEGKHTAAALRTVLEFIDQNKDVCDVRIITPAASEYNTVG